MSNEAEFVAALGQAGRAPEILDDPRWEGFAAGTLGGEEREALVAAARAAGLTEDEIAAFGPRDEAFDEKLAAVVGAGIGAGAGGARETDVGVGEEGGANPEKTSERRSGAQGAAAGGGAAGAQGGFVANDTAPASRGAVSRAVKRSRPAWMAPAGFVVAAAAAGVLLRSPGDAPWPGYAMTIEGGAAPVRNVPSEVEAVIVPDATVTVVARPERRVEGAAEARAFVTAGGATRRWDVPIEVADGGAARITGRAGELFAGVPAGAVRVCIAVGAKAIVSGMVTEPPKPGAGEVARYGLSCSSVRWQPEGAGR